MNYVVLLYLTKKMWFFDVGKDLKLTRTCEFQLAQLVKFLMGCIRDLGFYIYPLTPKTDWSFDLMIKSYYQEWTL